MTMVLRCECNERPIPFFFSNFSGSWPLCDITGAFRRRRHRRQNQKGFFEPDTNSDCSQKEEVDNKKTVAVRFAESVGKKEILAVAVSETKKEIFADAGGKRSRVNSSHFLAFPFAHCNADCRKNQTWCPECDIITRGDQRLRELSAESAATSHFGTRTNDPQFGLQIWVSRSG